MVRDQVQEHPEDLQAPFYDLANVWEESAYSKAGIRKTTVPLLGSNVSSRVVFLDPC